MSVSVDPFLGDHFFKKSSFYMTFVQVKEHWLRSAGAAVKRYPTPKVRETQVRCKRASEGKHTETILTEN